MKKNNKFLFFSTCAIVGLSLSYSISSYANPEGGVVTSGSASINQNANLLTINQNSDKVVIDWNSFDIDPNETTEFIQPSSSSHALNRINSENPSLIMGNLKSNGKITLINQNGVFFSNTSKVDVGGIIATSADIENQNFIDGNLNFNIAGKQDSFVINDGSITAKEAGLVGLIAPHVENNGIINARLGKVQLSSGEKFTLDLAGDGLIEVALDSETLNDQLVGNSGTISADGGEVIISAAAAKNVVNSLMINTGKIEARSVAQKSGKVILYAEGSNAVKGNVANNKGKKQGESYVINNGTIDVSGKAQGERGGSVEVLGDNVILGDKSFIDASGYTGSVNTTDGKLVSDTRINSAGGDIKIGGDYLGRGNTPTAKNLLVYKNSLTLNNSLNLGDGGRTIFWSDDTTNFYGKIISQGGIQGGDGGFVETSGKISLIADGYVDLLNKHEGFEKGTYLLDPENITIYGNIASSVFSASGLVAHYTFDEGTGTTAADSSGNSNTGTLFNSPTWSTSAAPTPQTNTGSLSFDGVNDYVRANDSNSLDLTNAFTISLWAKSSGSQTNKYLLNKMSTSGNNSTYSVIYGYFTNTAQFYALGNSFGYPNSTASSLIADTNWHLLTYTYDRTTFRNYQDGVLVNSLTATSNLTASTGFLFIGSFSASAQFYSGLIDDVRIYNNALTSINVEELYGSAFTVARLETMSATANISLVATNNIALDLQGDSLDLSSGRSLTLTASNQIYTNSAGSIATNAANINFNATNGIVLNHTLGLTTNGGNVNFNNNTLLRANQSWNVGAGSINFVGTLNSNSSISNLQVLAVAGGGGGGTRIGGGGGGGGVIAFNRSVSTSDSTSIVVGAGGATGVSGSNTTLFGATAAGGGRGGAYPDSGGLSGGSGGGGGASQNSTTSGGSASGSSLGTGNTASSTYIVSGSNGTGIYGNSGGSVTVARGAGTNTLGGGGGGAGAAGDSGVANTTTPRNGGSGIQSNITGRNLFYAGGGGAASFNSVAGGAGGLGGGGGGGTAVNSTTVLPGAGGLGGSSNGFAGVTNTLGGAGAANTGGGGGGGPNVANSGGAGGSGVAIIRYTGTASQATVTGSGTATTEGSDTVWRFTGNGTFAIDNSTVSGTNLTLTAANVSFGGAVGTSGRFNSISITSTNSLSLPAINAVSVLARATSGNISLGGNINTTGSGNAIVLDASSNFSNSGNYTLTPGTGRWIIYSTSAGSNTNGGLTASQTINSQTYNSLLPSAITTPTYNASQNTFVYSTTAGTVRFTANNLTRYYGDTNPTFTYTFFCSTSCSELSAVTGSPTITTTATQGSDVRDYQLRISQGTLALRSSFSGYNFEFVDGTLTVDPRILTAILQGSIDKEYNGDEIAELSLSNYDVSNIYNNDDVNLRNYETGFYDDKNVGTDISVTVSDLDLAGTKAANYVLEFTKVKGVGNITAKNLTITGLTGGNKEYDGNNIASLVGSGSLSGVIGLDDVVLGSSYSATYNNKNVANNKAITVSGFSLSGNDAGNYTISQPTGLTGNITAKNLTITAINVNKTYGDLDPTLTFNTEGFISGDSFSGALSRVTGENVGDYQIEVGSLSAGSNYNLVSFTPAVFTINQAGLIVTASNKSKSFGEVDPALTYTYSGLANGDLFANFTGNISRQTGETVGNYNILRNTLDVIGNYFIATFNNGNFVINSVTNNGNNSPNIPNTVNVSINNPNLFTSNITSQGSQISYLDNISPQGSSSNLANLNRLYENNFNKVIDETTGAFVSFISGFFGISHDVQSFFGIFISPFNDTSLEKYKEKEQAKTDENLS